MNFLGIDPGLQYAGFGVITKNGKQFNLLDCGYLKMNPKATVAERVHIFYNYFTALVLKYQINCVVLETPFLGKNAQNFLKLGYLRGVIYLIAQQQGLQILEYTPTQVKLAVTGFGGASKEQVARALKQLFPKLATQVFAKLDMTDALAVTLCGVWQSS